MGKSGVEMGEHLGGCRTTAWAGWRYAGWWPAAQKSGANRALSEVEPLPETLQGSVAQGGLQRLKGVGEATLNGQSEEGPHGGSGQAGTSDFFGEPGGNGASAPGSSIAITAKDPPGATSTSADATIIEAKK